MRLPAGTGDTQGAMAVLGDLTLGNGYSIGDQLSCDNDRYGLLVGGDLYWGDGALLCQPAGGNTFVRYAVGGTANQGPGSVVLSDATGTDNTDPFPADLPQLH